MCESGCDSKQAAQLLLRAVRHSLRSPDEPFAAHTHGLHARALAALAPWPCASSSTLAGATLPPAAELTVTQCWQRIFTHALDACDSRALAAILPWFAEYCTFCANNDYTHAVPQALLGAKRAAVHCPDDSLFQALLWRAQQVRGVCADTPGGASGEEQLWESLLKGDTVQYTCLALADSLAEWTVESNEPQCSGGGELWRRVAAAVQCEFRDSRAAQRGKETWGGAAGNSFAAEDWSSAAAREAALREAVRTLHAVEQGEQACHSSRAKGLLHVCSQLQALLGGD